MHTIYKYRFADGRYYSTGPTKTVRLDLPANAQVLSCQLRGCSLNDITIWAEVETENHLVPRYFEIWATGVSMPRFFLPADKRMDDGPRAFVATIQIGELVWHIFERTYCP